ncbi:sigma-70 family RNA polymerase sigma factor [Methylovulum psychrotolerans]|jgi:RNA polymerase sigma-70 factor (ECF subfamily)|uniref:RNA polymerase subunit sigma n=1 Tax=Methylovulum psychrotolerans TaxID=1704499 RepID=A0A1Z4BV68_9GAMM|nr:sigma-70 family RNA polymerase sigma factor [Methylovulum psychrotolerans]ASF45109.1 RNA polymerase subunit sigma [Methylovulum psychrotolerans]MBT9097317.1 sigma-70 family RNA polymerase sigma factor [Methylovulum psychrotolerans]POZ50570.1 RNA polymerase subunit sigma [Methylovulum psychrotolerans]
MQATSDPAKWLDEYGDALYRYALLQLRSEPLAEDMVQETLLAAWQSFAQFNGQSSVKTWLIGILKHKIIDHFRKYRHERDSESLDNFDDDDALLAHSFDADGHWKIPLINWGTPDKALTDEQFWQVFYRCLARLPQDMADLFILRTVDGLSSEECCKLLAIATTNQLCVALSRTRLKLRQCLEAQWFDRG